MAVKKEIIVVINADGELELELKDHKGAECKGELEPLEKVLAKVKERRWEREATVAKVAQKKKTHTKNG